MRSVPFKVKLESVVKKYEKLEIKGRGVRTLNKQRKSISRTSSVASSDISHKDAPLSSMKNTRDQAFLRDQRTERKIGNGRSKTKEMVRKENDADEEVGAGKVRWRRSEKMAQG
ncbi:hypothetical protein GWK47_036929 [Chionoecetes opilio]|uniref:Uncharacterized protein n=1 Tax=Chionoecetes opilio TaxID=41210 RepID=A0A8J4YDW7_CHIOP|nr:hypothetical protein GWK47_036929 [Chionoecetes opilio]